MHHGPAGEEKPWRVVEGVGILPAVALHPDEVRVDAEAVSRLLRRDRPDLADLPIRPVGGGTDNTMFRVGDDLVVRLPRTPGTTDALAKELRWLPRLAPHLPVRVPVPEHAGGPSPDFPLPWAIHRWIDGADVTDATVTDWAGYGRDLAGFVRALHRTDLMGARRDGALAGYRGGVLRGHDEQVAESLATVRGHRIDLDLDRLQQVWRQGRALPVPTGRHVWLHTDLRPGNVLVRQGRLCAVIDFGALTVGHPDAEHAPVWDLPAAARDSYRDALDLDDDTWARARSWAVMVGLSGVAYYWHTFPSFVAECLRRLRALAAD